MLFCICFQEKITSGIASLLAVLAYYYLSNKESIQSHMTHKHTSEWEEHFIQTIQNFSLHPQGICISYRARHIYEEASGMR